MTSPKVTVILDMNLQLTAAPARLWTRTRSGDSARPVRWQRLERGSRGMIVVGGGLLKTGIIVFAHGSRIEAANEAVRAVAAELARTAGYSNVEAAFLELGKPDLADAVANLAAVGVRRIIVAPYFLTLG